MDNITDLFTLTKTTLTNLPMLVHFMIGLTVFLSVPGISERFKIPGIVGLILVGLLGGPNGIDIWPDNPVTMTVLSEMGVLLILFYASLEIDLAVFKQLVVLVAPFRSMAEPSSRVSRARFRHKGDCTAVTAAPSRWKPTRLC